MEEGGIREALLSLNGNICHPPLPGKEVATIAKSISKYENPVPSDDDWGSLLPLPQLSESVPEMQPSLIPETLKPWITDIADRIVE